MRILDYNKILRRKKKKGCVTEKAENKKSTPKWSLKGGPKWSISLKIKNSNNSKLWLSY
jgi:hypothetical protein